MDDRKASLSLHDPGGRVGADAAPTAPGVRRPIDAEPKPVLPAPGSSRAIPGRPSPGRPDHCLLRQCATGQRGFVMASRAMGVEGHVGLFTANQNKEEH